MTHVSTSVQLPAIKKPTVGLIVRSNLAQVFVRHNPGIHLLMFSLYAAVLVMIIFLPFSTYALLIAVIPVVYFALTIVGGLRRRVTLDASGVKRQWLFGEFVYPYVETHKIILVKNLTFYAGLINRRRNGMALLLVRTDGIIPGFPASELAHQAYIKPSDMVAIFNAFDPKDRIELSDATRSDILALMTKLRA